jgi:hypothetical protein
MDSEVDPEIAAIQSESSVKTIASTVLTVTSKGRWTFNLNDGRDEEIQGATVVRL